jgi:hypothetical protein
MSTKNFDIAIIGGSLSARIAAALLAMHGCKVLFLRHHEATAPAWFHSSLFLEKLLATLGGRDCFVAQKPIQVLSNKARITLSNDIPLKRELLREFGEAGSVVANWLETLAAQGTQLEHLLWDIGGLPWPSFKAMARFKLLCLCRKVSLVELEAPVSESLGQLPKTAEPFMSDLLQGLAMKPVSQLSRGQAALLWAHALRPENLKAPDFSQMLSKRFDQFHGLKASLEDLESLTYDGSRWTGGRLKDSGQFTARHFLLGDTRQVDRFAAGKLAALPAPCHLSKLTTSNLRGQLSPLLASRIICGGDFPLRLAVEQQGEQVLGLILISGRVDSVHLRKQLEPALPFARYELSETSELIDPVAEVTSGQPPWRLASLPLRVGTNLYCADHNALLPEMGAAGAALLGWTLAENLQNSHSGANG